MGSSMWAMSRRNPDEQQAQTQTTEEKQKLEGKAHRGCESQTVEARLHGREIGCNGGRTRPGHLVIN